MIEKKQKKAPELSAQDQMMLDMREQGGDFVSKENLAPVLEWYESENK